jgi:hypothetical protein
MAWPASKQTLADRFQKINRTAERIKFIVNDVRARSLAGPVERQELINLQRMLDEAIGYFNAAINLPQVDRDALIAHIRSQFGDDAMDVAAEFVAMRDSAVTLRNWVFTNFPRDAGSQAVLVTTVNQAGYETALTFTTAQLAGFRAQADVFVATIG